MKKRWLYLFVGTWGVPYCRPIPRKPFAKWATGDPDVLWRQSRGGVLV